MMRHISESEKCTQKVSSTEREIIREKCYEGLRKFDCYSKIPLTSVRILFIQVNEIRAPQNKCSQRETRARISLKEKLLYIFARNK